MKIASISMIFISHTWAEVRTASGSLPIAERISSEVESMASRPPRIRMVVEEKKVALLPRLARIEVSTMRISRAITWRIHWRR